MTHEAILALNIQKKLTRARTFFAEHGYQIFTPNEEYLRSDDDFIAIDREFGYLFLVRAGKCGLEVRRRHEPTNRPSIIANLRTHLHFNVRQRHYLPNIDFDEWWQWIEASEYDGFQEALKQSGRTWRNTEQRSARGKRK